MRALVEIEQIGDGVEGNAGRESITVVGEQVQHREASGRPTHREARISSTGAHHRGHDVGAVGMVDGTPLPAQCLRVGASVPR